MIKLLRVDHRLLHGQVTFSWVNGIGVDCILVASDVAANSEVWKTTLKLSKPPGCKLVIKNMADSIESLNSGATDKYNLMIIVQTIADAKMLADNCPAVKNINLGNTKESPETKQISKQIFVTDKEIEMLKELINRGIEVEIRALADDKKVYVKNLI